MRAMCRATRPIAEALQAVAFIAGQPAVHRLPTHAPLACHLAHPPTAGDDCQNRLVPLLSHAHLLHGRGVSRSTEVAVANQPKVCSTAAEGVLPPTCRTCTYMQVLVSSFG